MPQLGYFGKYFTNLNNDKNHGKACHIMVFHGKNSQDHVTAWIFAPLTLETLVVAASCLHVTKLHNYMFRP